MVDFFFKGFDVHGGTASQTLRFVSIRSYSPPSSVSYLAVLILVWLKGVNTK